MRLLNAAALAFGVAVTAAVAASALGRDSVQYGAEVVTLVALAACAALARSSARRPVRLALVAFCLLLALGALVKLIGHQLPLPNEPLGPNGCPPDNYRDYWRVEMYYGQAYESLRFAALASAVHAVSMSPRRPHKWSPLKRLAIVSILAVTTMVGLYPLTEAIYDPGLQIALAPAVLTLTAAVALALVGLSRIGERQHLPGLLLGASTITILVAAAFGVEELSQIAGNARFPVLTGNVIEICVFAIESYPLSPPGLINLWVLTTALVIVAPAVLVWSVLNLDAPRNQAT